MDWKDAFEERLQKEMPGLKAESAVPMARHTSFHIGGPARLMLFPASAEELSFALETAAELGASPLVIGSGTNLLIADAGLDRPVIKTVDGVGRLERTGETEITAGAGVPLARLASFAQRCGLSGLEFAHGIPGSVGGAVVMNAGAYGGEMKDAAEEAAALDAAGRRFSRKGAELDFSYRHSVFSDGESAVLEARLCLAPGDPEEIRAKMEELAARRKGSQPLEYPSAGSFFKRPKGYYAAALIEEAGLKGTAVGGAQVSEKHAGFLINRGGATCADVLRLMEIVQETVFRAFGAELEPEVRILA